MGFPENPLRHRWQPKLLTDGPALTQRRSVVRVSSRRHSPKHRHKIINAERYLHPSPATLGARQVQTSLHLTL